jgi:uncharacterized protein YndB with AHSA1/START domain
MRIDRSVEIARDPAAVWAVLRDPSLMPEWFARLGNFARREGDGTREGDIYAIDYLRDSGAIELTVTVLEVDAPSGHVHRFEGLPVAFTITSRLDGDEGSTTWVATIEVRLSFVQRALTPVIKGYLDDLSGDLAEGFRNYMEER